MHLYLNTSRCIESASLFWELFHCHLLSSLEINSHPHQSYSTFSQYVWLFVPSWSSISILLFFLITKIYNFFVLSFWRHYLCWLLHNIVYVLFKLVDVLLSIYLLISKLSFNCIWLYPVVRIVAELLCSHVFSLGVNVVFPCAHDLKAMKITEVIINLFRISLIKITFTNLFLRFPIGRSCIMEVHLAIALRYNLSCLFIPFW